MGTNYYFYSKNKDLVKEFFYSYELCDEPDFHYKIHLNKCSIGWRTSFQRHKAFQTFKDLKQFYINHSDDLEIFDEYGEKLTLDEYEKRVIDRNNCKVYPIKFIKKGNHLDIERCVPEEADLYTPFIHKEYFEKEKEAANKFGIYLPYFEDRHEDTDPDYPVDWTDGEFC